MQLRSGKSANTNQESASYLLLSDVISEYHVNVRYASAYRTYGTALNSPDKVRK
jgi:hypothetical protein